MRNLSGRRARMLTVLLALAALVGFAAVETNVPPSLKAFARSEWVLKDLCGTPVPADSKVSLNFGSDGSVSGNGGVNRFNGRIRGSDNNLKAGPFMSTKMAGPPEAMAVEGKYLKALSAATKFEAEGDTLRVTCNGENKPLVFTRKPKL